MVAVALLLSCRSSTEKRYSQGKRPQGIRFINTSYQGKGETVKAVPRWWLGVGNKWFISQCVDWWRFFDFQII
jgi:hypothetical protein